MEFCYNKIGDIMSKKKKKKLLKIKKGPIIFLIILIIIIILLIHFSSKVYVFTKAYNKMANLHLESYKEIKNKYSPYSDGKYLLETDTIFDYNDNKNKVNGKIYIDGSDNYFDLDITKNEQKDHFSIINKDNKTYYKLEDSFIYTDNPNNEIISDKKISIIISKYFKKYIKKGTITKKKETIKYDKEYKTSKLTLKLSNKDYYNLLLDIMNDNTICKMYNNKSTIKEIENKKKKEKYTKDYFEYSIHMYKGNPILEEYNFPKENERISIFTNKDYKHIIFKMKDSKKDSYIIIKDNKIDLFIDQYFYGKGTITDNEIKVTFTDYNKKEIGSLSYTIEKKDDDYVVSFKMKTDLDSLKLNIDINNKIDTNKSIPSLDLKNAKSINELGEEGIKLYKELLSM